MNENNEFLPGDQLGNSDVSGHAMPEELPEQTAEPAMAQQVDPAEEDVEGHVQPRRDLDIERRRI